MLLYCFSTAVSASASRRKEECPPFASLCECNKLENHYCEEGILLTKPKTKATNDKATNDKATNECCKVGVTRCRVALPLGTRAQPKEGGGRGWGEGGGGGGGGGGRFIQS